MTPRTDVEDLDLISDADSDIIDTIMRIVLGGG